MVSDFAPAMEDLDGVVSRGGKITPAEAARFIERHDIFGGISRLLAAASRRGITIAAVEGADATGKTTIARAMGRGFGYAVVENQSSTVFRMVFGLPKSKRMRMVDYSGDSLSGLLFYLVVNCYALEKGVRAAIAKKKKFIALDSFVLRTLASHSCSPKGPGTVRADAKARRFIGVLLDEYIPILERNRSMITVFMFASESIRKEQAVRSSAGNSLDRNELYARGVSNYLSLCRNALGAKGVRYITLFSTASEGVQHRRFGGDERVFVKPPSRRADILAKAAFIASRLRQSKV